jgi:hypothetical protein
VDRTLNILIGLSALAAAVLWFWSASMALPQMGSYWDQAPPTDPFYVAVKRAARVSAWAAGFTGVSALLSFVKALVS